MLRAKGLLTKIASASKQRNVRTFHGAAPIGVRVLATDGVDELCVKIFKDRGHQVDFLKTLPEAELIKIIGDYEGLVVRSATKVNANVLNAAKKMRLVGRAGVGVDNIDVVEATKRGVMVMNVSGIRVQSRCCSDGHSTSLIFGFPL
jgi:D-3-phosphoglycerate dehydrogenase